MNVEVALTTLNLHRVSYSGFKMDVLGSRGLPVKVLGPAVLSGCAIFLPYRALPGVLSSSFLF